MKKLEATEGTKNFPLVLSTPHGQGRQGHQDKKGKHNPGHQRGEFRAFPGTAPKSGAMNPTSPGENHMPAMTSRTEEQAEAKDHVVGQLPGLSRPRRCS